MVRAPSFAARVREVILVVVTALVSSHELQAQRGELRGRVLDSLGRGLSGARVEIPALRLGESTDAQGGFSFPEIAPGSYALHVRRIGFRSDSATVTVIANERIEHLFRLVAGVALEAVETSAPAPARGKLAGFEERRRTQPGVFWTQEELEKQDARRFAEVIARKTSGRVRFGSFGYAWLEGGRGKATLLRIPTIGQDDIKRGARTNRCYARVFVDGTLVFGGMDGEPLFNLNSLSVSSIAGVEYYAGGARIPTQYGGTGTSCGVLLVWTR